MTRVYAGKGPYVSRDENTWAELHRDFLNILVVYASSLFQLVALFKVKV